jgi:drug/metabolite transporter (DMT)-like permease
MNWLIAAMGGHLLNAVAFIVDKSLLSTAFKRSGTYATVIGLFSSTILVFLPFVNPNLTPNAWVAVGIFGSVFVLAIWAFFEALSHAETSRVVPVVGSLIPLFTLVDSAVFLNERLAPRVLSGLAFLLAATFLLTRGGDKAKRLRFSTLGLCFFAAFMFAASSVSGKYAFSHAPFMDAFVLSRVFSIIIALAIPLFLPSVQAELWSLFKPTSKGQGPGPKHVALMLVGQACGALGFIGVQYAISLGSATVVNALQAVQYAAIVLVAWLGGSYLSHVLKEDRSGRTILLKSFAIILVAIGLALVSMPAA